VKIEHVACRPSDNDWQNVPAYRSWRKRQNGLDQVSRNKRRTWDCRRSSDQAQLLRPMLVEDLAETLRERAASAPGLG